MNLETAGSRSFQDINEHQLRAVFEDDDGRGEFLILSQEPERYMQASGEADGPYCLEYRDGDGDHHFSAAGALGKEDVLQAFVWYLAGDARWRSEFIWEKLTL